MSEKGTGYEPAAYVSVWASPRVSSMTTPIVRTAQESDLHGLLELYRHLHPDDPQSDSGKIEAVWSALISSGFTKVVVAVDAGMLVSSCTLAIIPNLTRGARSYGVIENVVTHPAHRGTGLGRGVLSAALDAAWKADCYKVVLATGSRQEETLRFYEQAGLVRGGKTYFEARRP